MPTMVSQLSLNSPPKIKTMAIALLMETARRVAAEAPMVREKIERRIRPPSSGWAGRRFKIARYKFAHTRLLGRLPTLRKGHFHRSAPRPVPITTAIATQARARLTNGPTAAITISRFQAGTPAGIPGRALGVTLPWAALAWTAGGDFSATVSS